MSRRDAPGAGLAAAYDAYFASQVYDRRYPAPNPSTLDFLRRWIRVGAEGRVLDLGCGNGRYALPLLETGAFSLVGCDISAAALQAFRSRLQHHPARGRVLLLRGEAASLPPGPAFDAVMMMFGVLAHIDARADRVATLQALRRRTRAGGRLLRLGDIATVRDTFQDIDRYATFNGEPSFEISVSRIGEQTPIGISDATRTALERIRATLPTGIDVSVVNDRADSYRQRLDLLSNDAIVGLVLVLILLTLFLDWKLAFWVSMGIPIAFLGSFLLLPHMGVSFNMISMFAFIIAIGIVVDDAIVVIENIARHIRMGKTPYRAAIDAADEIGLAVIATTFTIIAVFVPVSFMAGIPGQYFRQFGLTVAIAVGFSLMVARLITPMMAAYLMSAKDANAGHHEGETDGPVMRRYLGFVNRSIRGGIKLPLLGWRLPSYFVTLFSAIGVLIVSVYFMLQVPGSFLPPEDVSRISVSVELPPGATLEDTDTTTQSITKAIKDIEGVRDVFVLGGSSPRGELDIRRASVAVVLDRLDHSLLRRLSEIGNRIPVVSWLVPTLENHGRVRTQKEIEVDIFERLATIPDIRALKLNDRGERDISYSVLAANDADLTTAVIALETALRSEPTLTGLTSEGALPRPEVQVTPRPDEAARLGVTAAAIAQTLRIATIGDLDAALAQLNIDDRLIPVRVQLADVAREDLHRIAALKVQTTSGSLVPLSAVADVTIGEGPATVKRLNRERQAIIGASLPMGVALGTAKERFNAIVAATPLPAGVTVKESGDAEVQAELMSSFGQAMIMGLMLVLSVLILLFGSVIQPFTILLSLPLAIGGVAAALILTGSALSMPVLIGILMLMGIVTKNAILLIDFIIEMRTRGHDRMAAVIEAGHKRAQPIVMTSIAMSAGMLPSALGVGEGGAFRAPMATAVIGGIIVSTVLSLVVVPSFYLIMDDLSRLLGKLFSRVIGPKEVEPETPSPEALAAQIAALEAGQADLRARMGGTLRAAE